MGWQISPSDHEDPLSQVTADLLCLAQAAGLGGTSWHSHAPGIIHKLVPTAPLQVFWLLWGWNVLFSVLFWVGITSVWCFRTGSVLAGSKIRISECGHRCWPTHVKCGDLTTYFLPSFPQHYSSLYILNPSFCTPTTTPNGSFVLFFPFFILLCASLSPQQNSMSTLLEIFV